MKKRRHPPSERHVDIASRVLAEMIIRRPEPQQPPPPHSASGLNPPIKVKDEPGEEKMVKKSSPQIAKPVAMSLVDFSFVLSLVFGGCCTNVWTYEYLLKMDSRMGTALTFSQMAFVTLHSLPSFLTFRKTSSLTVPQLKPRQVPLSQWALQVLVLTAGSLLNNWAFAYQVPLTVQIVFRSAGLAVSMLFGRLFLNKRYSYPQILSVLFVTLGVILATTSRPMTASSVQDTSNVPTIDLAQYTTGIVMLTASLILTGFLGLLQEKTYTQYGPCWREGLFYTHALALPIFLLFVPNILHGLRSLKATSIQATPPFDPSASSVELLGTYLATTYKPYLILAGNLVTQLVCVSGVNQLTSRVSSVSTNLVLTTRKAISLCFSVWWFGNGWNSQLGLGAGMVFSGSLLYTLVSSKSTPPSKKLGRAPVGVPLKRSSADEIRIKEE